MLPVEFLSDDEAAAYGRYVGKPTRTELEDSGLGPIRDERHGDHRADRQGRNRHRRERARQHPKLACHSATLAVAVETLLEVTEYGEELWLERVWEAIDAIVPRRELKERWPR